VTVDGDVDGVAPSRPSPEGEDPDAFDRLRRRVLWSMPSGLYVVGTAAGAERNLMTANWVTQVALEPKLVAMSVEVGARSYALASEGGAFTVSLVPRGDRAVVRRFVKPVTEIEIDEASGVGTMQGEAVRLTTSGVPVLSGAAAWLECALRRRVELGSHGLFVGEVVDCGFGAAGPPATGERLPVLRIEDTRMNYGG
jgi:flavin reductase (DIM6/NTAB) family NADH-FMN oxidoreductase RutF